MNCSLRWLQAMHQQSRMYQTVLLNGQGAPMHNCMYLPSFLPAGAVIAALSEIDSSVTHLFRGVIIMSLFSIRKKIIDVKGPFTADKGDWRVYSNSLGQKEPLKNSSAERRKSLWSFILLNYRVCTGEQNWTELAYFWNLIFHRDRINKSIYKTPNLLQAANDTIHSA